MLQIDEVLAMKILLDKQISEAIPALFEKGTDAHLPLFEVAIFVLSFQSSSFRNVSK